MSAGSVDGLAVAADVLCRDRFDEAREPGTVVGSVGPWGAVRQGVDVEGRIGIDNGALRLQPLAQSGWGRQGVAYGPFEREPGLAMAVHVLNGHNSSQTFHHPESWKAKVRRVLSDARRLRFGREHHYENLAVGFMPEVTPTDPLARAHAFVMHAATADNGELWVAHESRRSRTALGILNVPFVFVVVLRASGAAYYTSSVPGATGASAHPRMRPVGIDTATPAGPVYAAVQQRILGEVGYRVDTRVYGVQVATVPAWSGWSGTAHAADRLGTSGPLRGRAAETGQVWEDAGGGAARLATGQPVGLLHVLVEAGRTPGAIELGWRADEHGPGLVVRIDASGAALLAPGRDGSEQLVASDAAGRLRRGATHAVEVLDDGTTVAVHVDGHLVGETWSRVAGRPDPDLGGVTLRLEGGVTARDLEAHPRELPMIEALDCGAPWVPDPSELAVDERFDATVPDLHGAVTPSGGRRWSRDEGEGRIELVGDRARVRADREAPNPGRTIFTIPWDDPGYADLCLDMVMPGTARGEGHDGRCGVVFWQDPESYLVVNLFVDDAFDGASVSTFYRLGGYENMYDAVWTLVRGVEFGRPCSVRCAFDGERFVADVNGEPALVRALTDVYPDAAPLRIERVGIVVNREWGDDTGSVLQRFTAGRRAGA